MLNLNITLPKKTVGKLKWNRPRLPVCFSHLSQIYLITNISALPIILIIYSI